MSKTISFGLSTREIQNAIKEVREYQNSLTGKCEKLCRRLTAEGMQIAQAHIGSSGFGKYVRLTSEISPETAGCKALLIMGDSQKIVSKWQNQDGVQSKEISPSLMLCFGSGLKAENPTSAPGVGAGSYGEHGLDPNGWWYMDLNGVWHHSTGIEPKMPMYNAAKELRNKVVSIAKDVFKS